MYILWSVAVNFSENADVDMMRIFHLDFGDGVARPGAAKSEKRDKGWKLRESRS